MVDGLQQDERALLSSLLQVAASQPAEAAVQLAGLLAQAELSDSAKVLLLNLSPCLRRLRAPSVDSQNQAAQVLAEVHTRLASRQEAVPEQPSASSVADQKGVDDAIIAVYQGLLGRTPSAAEIEETRQRLTQGLTFVQRVNEVASSAERQAFQQPLMRHGDAEFVQLLYEVFKGDGARMQDIDHWLGELSSGTVSREQLLRQFLGEAFAAQLQPPPAQSVDTSCFHIWSTDTVVTLADWQARVAEVTQDGRLESPVAVRAPHIGKPHKLITAIASLYRGGAYIEQFLENLSSQAYFDQACELVIVDASSPEDEASAIARYAKAHKNIRYHRVNYRIGVYAAWNMAIEMAAGEYLTNTNVDDLRRQDSLALQASILDARADVDVVYQNFYYTFDPHLSFEQIAAIGYQSQLPALSADNMLQFNSPHNAPMWRKKLHDELGRFDASYRSAGDYEFWMRCLVAGKSFYKITQPHVAYYENPHGISTRADTDSGAESRRIRKQYARQVLALPPSG